MVIYHKSQSGKTCIDVAINETGSKDEDVNIKSILENWPMMMVIIVSEELVYSLLDIQEYL